MKSYLKDILKIFIVIAVISLLVVVYAYAFDFVDYLTVLNKYIAYGLATFLFLSMIGFVLSAMVLIGGYEDYMKQSKKV